MRLAAPFAAALGIAIVAVASCAVTASPSGSEPKAFVSRLEAELLVETLNSELLSHDSATATLERWCGVHHLADPATIVAERVAESKTPSAEQRHDLRVEDGEVIRYRRVKLRCGPLVLSEADNWYVPSRLAPEMNKLLDSTDTPFGRVVKSLDFRRHTISVSVLAQFLPPGWETMTQERIASEGEPCVPAHLLEHRAILTLPDGTPFSEVIETYTGSALAVPGVTLHACAR